MSLSPDQLNKIKQRIVELAKQQGFQDARVSNTDTGQYFEQFKTWVANNYHGDMSYLERNQELRQFPEQLQPETLRVISLRYDYLPEQAGFVSSLQNVDQANLSRYALGKDYHNHLRKKLNRIGQIIEAEIDSNFNNFNLIYRVFTDSAPILETAFAEKSGLGWKGKHTLLINKDAGSWFFLGEIFINLALPVDEPAENLCGSCSACINLCPTDAIIGDNEIDATRCISYLTIENQGEIPLAYRKLLGNRIYGCDDCQLACPWNRYSETSEDSAFLPRYNLNKVKLLELWQWSEQDFLTRFEGSPIRRIGYQNWLRNLAVAIGNGNYSKEIIKQLKDKKLVANDMVNEHIDWAINELESKLKEAQLPEKTKKLINCVTNMLPRDA